MLYKGVGFIDKKKMNKMLGIPSDAEITSIHNNGGQLVIKYLTSEHVYGKTEHVDNYTGMKRHELSEDKTFEEVTNTFNINIEENRESFREIFDKISTEMIKEARRKDLGN